MYGLEKQPDKRFTFDLEKEIKAKPNRWTEIIQAAEKNVAEIKKLLREGANEKDFHLLGTLLHGYTSLQKVLRKAMK